MMRWNTLKLSLRGGSNPLLMYVILYDEGPRAFHLIPAYKRRRAQESQRYLLLIASCAPFKMSIVSKQRVRQQLSFPPCYMLNNSVSCPQSSSLKKHSNDTHGTTRMVSGYKRGQASNKAVSQAQCSNCITGLYLSGPQKVPIPVLVQTQSSGQKQTPEWLCALYDKQTHGSWFDYTFTSRLAFWLENDPSLPGTYSILFQAWWSVWLNLRINTIRRREYSILLPFAKLRLLRAIP